MNNLGQTDNFLRAGMVLVCFVAGVLLSWITLSGVDKTYLTLVFGLGFIVWGIFVLIPLIRNL